MTEGAAYPGAMHDGLGQHAPPTHVVAHLSDTHLLAGGALLGGAIDTAAHLRDALARLELAAPAADALVVSGDCTDLGEPDAYRLLQEIVEPVAERMGAIVVYAAGNHDEREPMWHALHGIASDAPYDHVHDVGGLRIVSLDSSLAGFHHGGFDEGQAQWLADALATPAEHGTLLVMHHPPLPYRARILQVLEFQDEPRLAEVLDGSDVRAILSGHLHVNGSGTFAGVPVVLANATSYADDLAAGPTAFTGIDGAQSANVLEVYAHTVAHSVVPGQVHPSMSPLPAGLHAELAALDPAARVERFSRKR